jgi:hypothetical protein
MDITDKKIAEVIESNSAGFTAQCYVLEEAPPLGALVKVNSGKGVVFGMVCYAETHGLEPGRRIIARGENVETEEDIYRMNPQIKKLLTTDIKMVIVGHQRGDNVFHYLPQSAVAIHSFVYFCTQEEIRNFTGCLDYLKLLIDADLPVSCDEIIAASIRYAGRAYSDHMSFFVRAGRELAALLSGDSTRLNAILKRLRI